MSTEGTEVVVVIGPGSIGAAIARHVGAGRTLLLAAHNETTSQAAADQLRSDGYAVAVQATDISDLAQVEALAAKSTELGSVTQVIQAAGVSPTQASIERIMQVDLLGAAHVLDVFARVIAPGGAGIVVASMAGHRESPYAREIENALATTETAQLLTLPPVVLHVGCTGRRSHASSKLKPRGGTGVAASGGTIPWGNTRVAERCDRVQTVSGTVSDRIR